MVRHDPPEAGRGSRVWRRRRDARDGSLALPPDVLEAVPPGTLLRVVLDDAGTVHLVPHGAVVVLATHDPEAAAACEGEPRRDEGQPTWVRPLHDVGEVPDQRSGS